MDFQKERESFVDEVRQLDSFNFYEFSVSPFEFNEEMEMFYFPPTQLLWEAWQAAKAKAVPEGFVLVPKEPTLKMIDATWDYDGEIQEMSHNTRNEFIYKAMIEAQEPAND